MIGMPWNWPWFYPCAAKNSKKQCDSLLFASLCDIIRTTIVIPCDCTQQAEAHHNQVALLTHSPVKNCAQLLSFFNKHAQNEGPDCSCTLCFRCVLYF